MNSPDNFTQDVPKHSGDQESGKPQNPKKQTYFFFLLPLSGASHGSEVSP